MDIVINLKSYKFKHILLLPVILLDTFMNELLKTKNKLKQSEIRFLNLV